MLNGDLILSNYIRNHVPSGRCALYPLRTCALSNAYCVRKCTYNILSHLTTFSIKYYTMYLVIYCLQYLPTNQYYCFSQCKTEQTRYHISIKMYPLYLSILGNNGRLVISYCILHILDQFNLIHP